MFALDTWMAYTAACVLLVMSPGPANLMAISHGLSQGRRAACISGLASGTGVVFHVLAATAGLTMLMQQSALAFWIIKIAGAAYLISLGLKAWRSRGFIEIDRREPAPLSKVFLAGFLVAALNPKPGMFVLAFIPQFVDPGRGSPGLQMLAYGLWLAVLSTIIFGLMGMFASRLSRWLHRHGGVADALNKIVGVVFLASGLAVAMLKHG